MDERDFSAQSEQPGTLTDVQRLAILPALERKASGPEALALIEVPPRC